MYFFKSFTWGQYLEVVFLAAILFYLYVAMRYYPTEIMDFISGRLRSKKKTLIPIPMTLSMEELQDSLQGDSLMGPVRTAAYDSYVEQDLLPEESFLFEVDEIDLVGEGGEEEPMTIEPGTPLSDLARLLESLHIEPQAQPVDSNQRCQKIQDLLSPFHVLADTPLKEGITYLILTNPANQTFNSEQINSLWDEFTFESFLDNEIDSKESSAA